MESTIEDDNVRLSYLIQYCTGKAKEAIENCVTLPGAEGYKAARDILIRNFGQRHVIIRSLVNKVVKGPQLKSSDEEKLSQLALDMRICQLNSSEMRYEADINSMDTLTTEQQSHALKRLDLLKRRLEKDVDLKRKYKETVREYISLEHAQKIPDGQVGSPVWYLPHHPVVHPQKPDKGRVVFDCAARFRNTSLNDQLLQGPDLTNSLVGVLLRFRQEQIGISADIETMFHQVRVSPQDTHALSFLWWPGSDFSKKPEDHQMLVHLFGARSSPGCSSFSLKKTAEDNRKYFNAETTDTVNRNFYIDDCLKSVASTDEAVQLVDQLPALLRRGGFRLTK